MTAPAPRADLDVRIDDAWHRMMFATDPDIEARYRREYEALVAERAQQAEEAS